MNRTFTQQRNRERLAGFALVAAAAAALVAANSPLADAYHAFLHFKPGLVLPRAGEADLHLLVVDGLMAIFFLLIGLEVKREWFEGQLATREARRLPVIAAMAGMAVPAIIYLAVAWNQPQLHHGWAVPTATDIAFAVAVLALLGSHAPPSLKVLLIAVAIVDDIGAVTLIALFYTDSLDVAALAIAFAIVAAMATASLMGVRRRAFYLLAFAVLWVVVLESGVHPTIAGVAAGLAIPLGRGEARSTLEELERDLHPWVMFAIVPLFGFVSAGVYLGGWPAALLQPLPLAIALGLFAGKQAGVFAAIRFSCAAGLCAKPAGATWPQVYGAALLTGIGFTMSLFIAGLAFGTAELLDQAKLGVLAGSLLSAAAGWAVLRFAAPPPSAAGRDIDQAERIFAQKERAPRPPHAPRASASARPPSA